MAIGGLLGTLGQGATIAIVIKGVDQFSTTFSKSNAAIKGLTVAVGTLAVGLTAVGVSSVKVAADFEQTRIGFETMLGSTEKAAVFLKDLADFAKNTPFTLQGVESAARKLLAVGFAAEDVLPNLKNVGDIASGLGLGQAGLDRLILNLGQVQAQGKLTGRELRDFAVAGIPLLDELAKSMGKSSAEIQEMVSGGEILTADVLKAFEQMTGAGGRFEDLMAKQMDSVAGKFSNVQDSIELMQRELGNVLLPTVSDFVDELLNGLLPAVKPMIPIFGEFLLTAVRKVTEIFNILSPIIREFFENHIKPNIPVLKEIGSSLFEIFKIGLQFAGMLINALGPALDIVLPILKVFLRVLQAILEILRPIVKFISTLVGGLLNLGGKAIGAGVDFLDIKPANTNLIATQPRSSNTIYINNVNGLSGRDIANSLQDELENVIVLN